MEIIHLISKHNINFPECIWNMTVKSKIHMNFEIVTSWISSEDQIMIYTALKKIEVICSATNFTKSVKFER